jgi:membrane-bound lytic murein transglycosylase B
VKRKRFILFVIVLLAIFFAFPALAAGTARKARGKKRAYVLPTASEIAQRKADMAADVRGKFPASFAEKILNDPRFTFEPRIVERYEQLAENPRPVPFPRHLPRMQHRFAYITNTWSKEHGLAYLMFHEPVFRSATLQFASISSGIPAGIIDAETQYGSQLGKNDYPTLRSLLTLVVYDPDKKVNPHEQLLAFLRLCEKNHWDPYARMGSWTGAFGLPQFEPVSYEDLAMYWDGAHCKPWQMSPEPIDLTKDNDAICSIFNYLHADGFGGSWARQRRILYLYNRDTGYCDAILRIARYFNERFGNGVVTTHARTKKAVYHHSRRHVALRRRTTSTIYQRAALQ